MKPEVLKKLKKIVCDEHYQWYDDDGNLHTLWCKSTYGQDATIDTFNKLGTCPKCHDLNQLAKEDRLG